MKNYNLLIFDWDGTLFDSNSLALEALLKTAQTLNQPLPEDLKPYLGLSLPSLQQQLFPKTDYLLVAQTFYEYFNEEALSNCFFPETLKTLALLKRQGFTLAVATNKSHNQLSQALHLARLETLFAATRTADQSAPKPHPEMLLTLLEELNCSAAAALMIGDTTLDLQMAQNAKVDALAVCYGFHPKAQLAKFNPVGFLEQIAELPKILTTLS